MDEWNIPLNPGTQIMITIPHNLEEGITVKSYSTIKTNLDIIAEFLRESIKDLKQARIKAREIAPNLLPPL